MSRENLEITVTIPSCYTWMANGKKELYLKYVEGYLKVSHPGLKLIKIKKTIAICVEVEKVVARKKTK